MLQHTSQQAHGKLDEQLAQRVSKKGHTSLALSHWGEPQGSPVWFLSGQDSEIRWTLSLFDSCTELARAVSSPRVQRPHREIWIDLRAGQSLTVWECTRARSLLPPEMSLSWLYTQAVGQEAGEQPCTGRSGAFDASSVSVTSVPWQPEGSPVSWGA